MFYVLNKNWGGSEFRNLMWDTAVFVSHEVLEEPEHDLCFYEIPVVFLLPYYAKFTLTLIS